MRMIPVLAVLTVLALAALPDDAGAQVHPKPMRDDPRVQQYVYDAAEVFELKASVGFVTTIQFREDERIEGVSAGDTLGWEITPAGNRKVLFLKPVDRDATRSNMTVLTSERVYSFAISVDPTTQYKGGGDPTFLVRFRYPKEEAAELAQLGRTKASHLEQRRDLTPSGLPEERMVSPEDWNFDYTYRGSDDLRPTRIFDDGEKTYFEFSDTVRQPAIFAVDQNGDESLVNFDIRGRYYVVHALGRQFTVRDGPTQTCIYNKRFPGTVEGPLSPALEPAATFLSQIMGGS